ncbi:MAG: L-ascorbate 6-phosphate lactonase [Candidatus Bathyarchaeia archaeon]
MAKRFGGLEKKIDLLTKDRPIDRLTWLQEVFPEWGTFLNEEIEDTVVEEGNVALWWLGACSYWFKTPKKTDILIDAYSGPSIAVKWGLGEPDSPYGVLRQTGATSQVWLRLNPQVIDPFAIRKLDALLSTHPHVDHCDIYTIKPLTKNTDCKFVGPPRSCRKFMEFGVPRERVVEVKPGDEVKIGEVTVKALEGADNTAVLEAANMNETAVNYLLKTPGGNIYHAGDSHYSNMFFRHGRENRVDVAMVAFGDNPSGMTDKMTAYDAYRVGKALGAKLLIPMHYDNWSLVQGDPQELEWLVKKKAPGMKTVILQWGCKFIYPKDQDIGRAVYPKGEEDFVPERSWEYGEKPRIFLRVEE